MSITNNTIDNCIPTFEEEYIDGTFINGEFQGTSRKLMPEHSVLFNVKFYKDGSCFIKFYAGTNHCLAIDGGYVTRVRKNLERHIEELKSTKVNIKLSVSDPIAGTSRWQFKSERKVDVEFTDLKVSERVVGAAFDVRQ